MVFSDNQTKHFYALKPTSNDVAFYSVKDLNDSDLFRIMLYKDSTAKTNNEATATTDVINRKLIKKIKINEVEPTYYRKWVVKPMTGVTPNTTYYLYFYLENMYGFGIQDRWDLVCSHTATSSDNANTVMTALKDNLVNKISAKGSIGNFSPIANDFIVTVLDSTLTKTDADFIFGVTATSSSISWTAGTDTESLTKGSGTTSGKKYTLVKHEGTNKVTYTYDNVAEDYADNTIIVLENKGNKTFEQLDVTDFRMHDNPYVYDVALSTYDGSDIWGSNEKRIRAQNTTNVYVSAAQKVQAMELYFLRNRVDLYDLTPNFGVSILNQTETDTSASQYYTLDIDYAFSDTQGYTYHSDKQLSIACSDLDTLKALKEAVLEDSNETSKAAAETYVYSSSDDD